MTLSDADGPVPVGTWRERAVAFASAILLTSLLTYPTITQFGSSGRLDTNDGKFSIWNVAWVAHALVDDPRHLFDANIFYPHRSALTYSELNLVAGAFAAPVYAVTRNPLAAHNSAVFLALVLAFCATWALVRRLTGSSGSALLSATGYTFSAYTSSHTPEIQLLMIFGFPLILLAFHRLHDRPTLMRGASLGGALALTALSSVYAVFAGGLVGLAAVWWGRRDRAYWIAIATAAVSAAAFAAPVVAAYLNQRAAQGVVTAPALDEIQAYSATWRAYLRSGTLLGETWLPWLGSGPDEVLFPGIMLIAGAIAGLASAGSTFATRRRTIAGYAVVAGMAGWASFGPARGLYRLLMYVLPGISFLRAPARLAPVVILALAVLAGFGAAALLKHRTRGARAWLTGAALAMLCAELWVPWPLQPMPPVPRAYQLLAALPRGAVVEFPFPYRRADFHNHVWTMLMSTYHWQPLVNGYSDFTPPDFEPLALPINGFPNAESFEIMRAHDVRYVTVRTKDYGPKLDDLRARFPAYTPFLHRLNDDEDVWLYQILSYPEGAPSR